MTETLFSSGQIIEVITAKHLEEASGLFFVAVTDPHGLSEVQTTHPRRQAPSPELVPVQAHPSVAKTGESPSLQEFKASR